jgi:hypothetical protein
MTPQDIFSIMAFLPFVVAWIAFLIDEKPIKTKGELVTTTSVKLAVVKSQVDVLCSTIKQPNIYKPALFLFLWQSTPTSDGAFLFFLTNDLGFGPEFFGRVQLITATTGHRLTQNI